MLTHYISLLQVFTESIYLRQTILQVALTTNSLKIILPF